MLENRSGTQQLLLQLYSVVYSLSKGGTLKAHIASRVGGSWP